MVVNLHSVFSNSDFLKYKPLKSLLGEVIAHPQMDKAKIVEKYSVISPNLTPQSRRYLHFIEKVWHKFKLLILRSYNRKFTGAVSKIQLSIKQNESATKIQKVFRGHRVRKQVKTLKAEEKHKRELQLEAIRQENLAKQQQEEALQKQKEATALQNLLKFRKKHSAFNKFDKALKSLTLADIIEKQDRVKRIAIKIRALQSYQEAQTKYDSAKSEHDRLFSNSKWLKALFSTSFTQERAKAIQHLNECQKTLTDIKKHPDVLNFTGNAPTEIAALRSEKTSLESSLERLYKIKILAEKVPAVISQPPAPSPLTPQPAPQVTREQPAPQPPITPTASAAYDIRELMSPKGLMLSAIATFVHHDLKRIWEQFFKKCDPQNTLVESWHCDAQGNFVIKVHHPIKMWVPSKNEQGRDDPKGGVVLMLGEPDKIVTGYLDKRTKSMNFEKGFMAHCHYHVPFYGEIPITPYVYQLRYENKDAVYFSVYLDVGIKYRVPRKKSVDNLITNWGTNGEVVTGDHSAFVNGKLHR